MEEKREISVEKRSCELRPGCLCLSVCAGCITHILFHQRCFVTAMGLTFSSILDTLSNLTRWTKEKDVRILMLGLDSAGKVRDADQFLVQLENGD